MIIIAVVVIVLVTYKHRQKYSIKSKVRRTSNVFDVAMNDETLPQESGKAKKLHIRGKHVPDDIEQVHLYHGNRGSMSAPEDSEENLQYDVVQRDLENPLYMEHEAGLVEDADLDVLDATATTQLIRGQK